MREIVNGRFYQLRGGISWRAMPHDLPPWVAVYDHFRRWKKNDTFERIHDALRVEVRETEGREATPRAVITLSQSVKTTGKGDPWLRRWQEGRGQEAQHRRRKLKEIHR